MKRFLVLVLLGISVFIGSMKLYADEKVIGVNDTFIIEGEETQYDAEHAIASASGNVKVWIGSNYLEANQFRADLAAKYFKAIGNVLFKEGEKIIRGDSIDYNWQESNGMIDKVKTNLDGLAIEGERLEISNGGLDLTDSSFTRCILADPHYKITARKIVIVPGKLVEARNATIWLGKVRLFTIPQYTVFLTKDGLVQPKYQTEIKYKLSSGPALHVKYFYLMDERNFLLTDTTVSLKDRVSLGAGYMHLGEKINYKLMFTKNGEVNDRRVDIWPELTVDLSKKLFEKSLDNTSAQIKLGNYVDSANGKSVFRKEWSTAWESKSINISSNMKLVSAIQFGQIWYTGSRHLNYAELTPNLHFKLNNNSEMQIGYRYLHKWGESELSFEKPETLNEVSIDASSQLANQWEVGLGTTYNLNGSHIVESRLSIARNYDCFGVKINMKEKEDKLSFDISFLD